MQELMDKLQHILGTPEGQAQLNNITSMLNLNQNATQQEQTAQASASQSSSFSQQATQPNVGNNQQSQSNSGFDLSSLASMLGGNNANANANNGNDMISSLLSSLQGGSQSQGQPQNNMPNIDINMIMQLQQVFSKLNTNDKNSQLLYALKPHFGPARQGKIDQAISMMRLMTMLPALQESGIFKGL